MISHKVKVYPSKIHLPKKNQLAWKLAEIASDNAKLDKAAIEMVINRIIDNASVAIASLNRKAVISSREMALKHPRKNGANLFGIDSKLKFEQSIFISNFLAIFLKIQSIILTLKVQIPTMKLKLMLDSHKVTVDSLQ